MLKALVNMSAKNVFLGTAPKENSFHVSNIYFTSTSARYTITVDKRSPETNTSKLKSGSLFSLKEGRGSLCNCKTLIFRYMKEFNIGLTLLIFFMVPIGLVDTHIS